MNVVHDRPCPKCGGVLLAHALRREWCPAVVPRSGGEPCGYGLRGGLDSPDRWRPALVLLMARIKAAGWRERNRRVKAARHRPDAFHNVVEQVP